MRASLGWCLVSGLGLACCDGSNRDNVDLMGRDGNDGVNEGSSMTIDPLAPVVTLAAVPATARGGTTLTLAFSVSALAPLTDLSLSFRRAESRVDPPIALVTTDQSYAFVLPIEELAAASFELRANDETGRSGSATSSMIHVDITPPSFVAASLVSPALTTSPSVLIMLPSCPEPDALVAIVEAPVGPEESWTWIPCASDPTQLAYQVAGEGVHTLHLYLSDAVGNVSAETSDFLIDYDATAPALSLVQPQAGLILKSPGMIDVQWSASDAHLASIAIAYTTNLTDFIDIAPNALNDGSESWTLPLTDGSYQIRIIAQDSLGFSTTALSGAFIVDGTGPVFNTTTINYDDLTMLGADSTGTVFVQLRLEVNDPLSPTLAYRLRETNETGNCQALYANNDWSAPQASPALLPFRLTPVDGIKKVCAWARDAAGNVNVIASPTAAAGPDRDTIAYFIDNPPEVTAFDVAHGATGTTISWTVTDEGPQAGLTGTPITLSYYTVSVGWQSIVNGYGPGGGDIVPPYSDSYTWSSRPGEPYRVRIVALDKNDNTSIPIVSDLRPADGNWSIAAGNDQSGIGGSARSFDAYWRLAFMQSLAVDPIRGDVYLFHSTHGLVRLDVRTGHVERFIDYGVDNLLSNGGDWPAAPTAQQVAPAFDSQGRLYVKTMTADPAGGGIIYQVDLSTTPFQVRHYLGGGLSYDGALTPNTVFVAGGGYGFDEENALYFFTSCVPNTYSGQEPYVAMRLMKAAQLGDGTPGAISILAGGCSPAGPPGSYPVADPLSVKLPGMGFPYLNQLSAFTHAGKKMVYFGSHPGATLKLIDGVLHSTDLDPVAGRFPTLYSAKEGKLYVANNRVLRYTVGSDGNGGEVLDAVVAASDGNGDATHACVDDEVLASTDACVAAEIGIAATSDGTVLFADGPVLGSSRSYRIRYVDGAGLIRSLLGTLPFHRHGLARHVVRGNFESIHYKPDATGGFPDGLYFSNGDGPVFGRIGVTGIIPWGDPNDDTVEIVWGNQSSQGEVAEGQTANRTTTLGKPYFGGNGSVMAFHPTTQQPWIRASQRLVDLTYNASGDHSVHLRQVGGILAWELRDNSIDAIDTVSYAFGGLSNLVWKDHGVFFIGSLHDPNVGTYGYSKISFFDLLTAGAKVLRITNGQGDGSPSDGAFTLGSDTRLPAQCLNLGRCPLRYSVSDDRLYYAEDNRLRYIANPTTTPSIGTHLQALPGVTITNYTFRPPTFTEVFFIAGGKLYSCDAPYTTCSSATPLGPPEILPLIGSSPNQMTWYDNDTLLISTGGPYVYRYVP